VNLAGCSGAAFFWRAVKLGPDTNLIAVIPSGNP